MKIATSLFNSHAQNFEMRQRIWSHLFLTTRKDSVPMCDPNNTPCFKTVTVTSSYSLSTQRYASGLLQHLFGRRESASQVLQTHTLKQNLFLKSHWNLYSSVVEKKSFILSFNQLFCRRKQIVKSHTDKNSNATSGNIRLHCFF